MLSCYVSGQTVSRLWGAYSAQVGVLLGLMRVGRVHHPVRTYASYGEGLCRIQRVPMHHTEGAYAAYGGGLCIIQRGSMHHTEGAYASYRGRLRNIQRRSSENIAADYA